MREKQDNWRRIEAVIKWANMSTNYFARYIGLPRGENLYQIKRGNNGISMNVAQRVVAKFPEIDKLWLLTGEGQMFVDSSKCGAQIPYYNLDVEQCIDRLGQLKPDGGLFLSLLEKRCDLAMNYTGRAMGSVVPSGSVVLLRAIDRDEIIPGQEYVIVSRKIVTLRIVRVAEEAGHLRLVAGDHENYDDMILKIRDIKKVYQVQAKLIINT